MLSFCIVVVNIIVVAVVAAAVSVECDDVGTCGGEVDEVTRLRSERDALRRQVHDLERELTLRPASVAPRYQRSDFACAVITTQRNHATKATAAKRAWASKCGVVMYISADPDDSLPTTVVPGSEEGRIINKKVFAAFERMWALYGDAGSEAQRPRWFIKADDDTFMQLDNLAALLARYDADNAMHYVGRAGEWYNVKYCGGGAGYVLSRALLRAWAPLIASCERLPVGEDVSVGKCLRDKLHVTPQWHAGFYHRSPSFFLNEPLGQRDHPEGLSPRPVSFHSLSPAEQATLSYLLYDTVAEPPAAQWRDELWPTTRATH
jgi:hypothetical protein